MFPLGYAALSGVWTNPANFSTIGGDNFITTNAKELRVVSWGVVFRSTLSATNAQGQVIISVDPSPAPSGFYPIGNMMGNETEVITLAAGTEHAFIGKPVGGSGHLFRPLSDYSANMSNFDWTSVVFEVGGGATTSGLVYGTMEVVMNVEMTLSTQGGTSAAAQLQKIPPVPNNIAVHAAARVQSQAPSFIQGGITKVSNTLSRYAMNALDDVLSEGMMLLTL